MNAAVYNIISLILAVLFLWGIHLMSSPKAAVKGNSLGAASMFTAILLILIYNKLVDYSVLWMCLLVGSAIGAYWGLKVKMTQMPQTVGTLNGFGGGASALVALVLLLNGGDISTFSKLTAALALSIGAVTFSGSIIAAGKLSQKITQYPVRINGHTFISYLSIAVLCLLIMLTAVLSEIIPPVIITLFVSLFFGVFFTIRVGGADMPITICLLNSLSGVAGAIAGLAIYDPLLVAVGGIVGASGLLLTQIMCQGMNRSLLAVLNGNVLAPSEKVEAPEPPATCPNTNVIPPAAKKKTIPEIMALAHKVVVVPGYGMAVAQAQHLVKQLTDELEKRGKQVIFAIHPVAGRMPGHMNVLLAEVDVPYDYIYDMDAINPEFPKTDVVIVVGANDVINPAAITAEGTPIYGMPILKAYEAKHIIVCNYDTKPGYAGVENPIYKKEHVTLMLGDAGETVKELINQLS